AASPLPDALPSLAGIDTGLGLAQMAGDMELYQTLLSLFLSNQGRSLEQFRQALHDNQPVQAVMIAHTLRGVAGNIGAQALAQAAGALEDAVKQGVAESGLTPLMAAAERCLREVMEALAAWSSQQDAEGEHAGDDQCAALFKSLHQQLAEESVSAIATAMRLAPAAARLGCGESFAEVVRSIEALDYGNAALRLRAWRLRKISPSRCVFAAASVLPERGASPSAPTG
ncbi:Hpt domain-containing protein, partial [Methylogaea oryzae]|uniref:Hpt domain-containing protein n=1 Tax=Methylogaea oryzae TaxID=1295382 RepID=UPI000A9B15A4